MAECAAVSAPQRIVAAIVLILVVLCVGFVALNAAGVPIGLGPDATDDPSAAPSIVATSEPSVSAPEASGTARPDEEELLAQLAEIEAEVIAIRGLEAAGIGPPDIITRAELGDELVELFDEEYPPEERERDNLALRALGLLTEEQDVAELQLQLLGDQVLGFYDDVEKRMVVVTDAGLDAAAMVTYAHEYTHALQDAAFGLDSLETDAEGEDDRSLARTALIEGDATVTMVAWAIANLSPEELAEIGTTPVPSMEGIPSWMVNQLQWPYTAGQLWAGALTVNPLQPQFAALDAAYAEPPGSTEQILHLEKWESREAPVAVEVPDIAAALGDGWEEVDDTPMGQAGIGFILEHFGAGREAATAAAEGWGGDRVRIATAPDGRFAVAWRSTWDTPEDATEFASAYETVIAQLPFPAVSIALSATEVLVVHAPDDALLRQVVDLAN